MSQSRRNFIKTTSLASIILVPGIGFFVQSCNNKDKGGSKDKGTSNLTRAIPIRLVDAHIHLFNARYLPLKAIIDNVPILTLIAGPIANLLYALTDDFDSQASSFVLEDDTLKTMQPDKIIDWFIDRTSRKLDYEANKTKSDKTNKNLEQSELLNSIADLAKEMDKEQKSINSFNQNVFLQKFAEQYSQANAIVPDNDAKLKYKKMYSDPVRWALKKLSLPNVDAELQQYVDCDGIPVINFLAIMMTDEVKIYQQATRGYGGANLALQIHYMMDMQASYTNGRTYYPFHPVQTANMMQLVNNSKGKLLGFTAFNPKNKNAMESFKMGIAAGNIGVKFYPPMDYKPFGDDDAVVRENVKDFFTYCETHQIPIFTHCTPVGFQAKKGSGLNSDPKYWEMVLKEHKNLRICFGHAGGGDPKVKDHDFHGWYSTPKQWSKIDCYAKKVVELCEEYENVYCEIAHLGNIIKKVKDRQRFTYNLIENFNRSEPPCRLKDKICFGTDWNMIGMINEQQHYYDVLVDIFQHPKLIGNIDNFFSENFISFLNIKKFISNNESDYLTQESRSYLEGLLN
ncbi:amidohydrolase family protein [Flavobacterium tructae]|uniref:Amidohydrolase-related domain-containing protein n=1 Tax=Flavobacterium tructae TaxID=1114873 RepID=A0A1S1J638_9FLAO|nr:amidohydrolase family protein [Flavobacterium tructae]OHT44959.1 hypothetical protein BHE19_09590 [Flavobacterium tructae]OXB18993.1 hypothetical protein B0A71_13710 [Flavobacterium tructae]